MHFTHCFWFPGDTATPSGFFTSRRHSVSSSRAASRKTSPHPHSPSRRFHQGLSREGPEVRGDFPSVSRENHSGCRSREHRRPHDPGPRHLARPPARSRQGQGARGEASGEAGLRAGLAAAPALCTVTAAAATWYLSPAWDGRCRRAAVGQCQTHCVIPGRGLCLGRGTSGVSG